MALMSLKDYAAMNNVTYEAVRQQVIRYAEELGNHIIKDGRQQFLDDEAIVLLNSKRQKNPVSIIQANKDDEIARLEDENRKLLIKIASQADKISELSDWKAEKAVLIAQAEQQTLLLEKKTKMAISAAIQETKIEAEKEKDEAIKQAEDKLKLEMETKQKESLQKYQEHVNDEIKKLQEELEREKNKSWIQKLLKK